MSTYYQTLPNIRVYYREGTTDDFHHCEYVVSGNYLIIYEEKRKHCLQLEKVASWELDGDIVK